MSTKVQVRRGTDADRGTMVLASGELGWTTDTKKLYIGDGTTYGGIDIAPGGGVSSIGFVIDGGGSQIATGVKGDLEVPFACHVDRWTLLADQHGSVAVDIWRDDYAAFPPTDADSMPGTTNTPAISGTIAAQGSALSGWGTRGITAGDILRYNVDSCVSIERVTLAFKVTKT